MCGEGPAAAAKEAIGAAVGKPARAAYTGQSWTLTSEPPEVATRVVALPRMCRPEPPESEPRTRPSARSSPCDPPLPCTSMSLTERSRPCSSDPPERWSERLSALPERLITEPPEPWTPSRAASTPRTFMTLPPLEEVSASLPRLKEARTSAPPLPPTARSCGVWMVTCPRCSPVQRVPGLNPTWSSSPSTRSSTACSTWSSASMRTGLRGPISTVAWMPEEIWTEENSPTACSWVAAATEAESSEIPRKAADVGDMDPSFAKGSGTARGMVSTRAPRSAGASPPFRARLRAKRGRHAEEDRPRRRRAPRRAGRRGGDPALALPHRPLGQHQGAGLRRLRPAGRLPSLGGLVAVGEARPRHAEGLLRPRRACWRQLRLEGQRQGRRRPDDPDRCAAGGDRHPAGIPQAHGVRQCHHLPARPRGRRHTSHLDDGRRQRLHRQGVLHGHGHGQDGGRRLRARPRLPEDGGRAADRRGARRRPVARWPWPSSRIRSACCTRCRPAIPSVPSGSPPSTTGSSPHGWRRSSSGTRRRWRRASSCFACT